MFLDAGCRVVHYCLVNGVHPTCLGMFKNWSRATLDPALICFTGEREEAEKKSVGYGDGDGNGSV